jgi:hypothetical protein
MFLVPPSPMGTFPELGFARGSSYFASRRRRSIVCAICSCCSAIFVKPFSRSCFAQARCHSGVTWASSSRGFLGSSSIDIFCAHEDVAPARACISLHHNRCADCGAIRGYSRAFALNN